jgi:hypothetical protein
VQAADQGVEFRVVAGAGDDVVEFGQPVAGQGAAGGGVAAWLGDPYGGVVAFIEASVVN